MRKFKAFISFLGEYFKMLPYRKQFHRNLVAFYLHFNGDKEKLEKFIKGEQELPDFQVNETLIGVNLKDYVTPAYPFAFAYYCYKKKLDVNKEICIKK